MKLFKLNQYFKTSNPNQMAQGKSWYKRAHDEACRISIDYDIPLHKVAGIISALSPSVKWEVNLRQAEAFIKDSSFRVSTYPNSRVKALYILENELTEQEVFNVLLGKYGKGKKTANFYMNILKPFSKKYVTIDRWIYRAVGIEFDTKHYDEIAQYIKKQAILNNILPNQLQAVVWEKIREGI